MYDLQTMIRVFAQQNVELRADIAPISGIREAGWARVTLVKGDIVACLIQWKNGEVFSGSQALHMIERVGALTWDCYSLTSGKPLSQSLPTQALVVHAQIERAPTSIPITPPQEASPQQTPASLFRPDLVPVRAYAVVPRQQFIQWPRLHRSVFNLVNGYNSIENIASLLNRPYETIAKILADLYAQDIVTFESTHLNKWLRDSE